MFLYVSGRNRIGAHNLPVFILGIIKVILVERLKYCGSNQEKKKKSRRNNHYFVKRKTRRVQVFEYKTNYTNSTQRFAATTTNTLRLRLLDTNGLAGETGGRMPGQPCASSAHPVLLRHRLYCGARPERKAQVRIIE